MRKALDEATLQEIIRRIVQVAQPEKIILFGFAPRGGRGPYSDADLLVVVDAPVHRRQRAQAIYRHLIGVGFVADIVVVTNEDMERYKDHPAMVIRQALEEGRLVYAAYTLPA